MGGGKVVPGKKEVRFGEHLATVYMHMSIVNKDFHFLRGSSPNHKLGFLVWGHPIVTTIYSFMKFN